jgi:hypothetical protein
MLTSRVRQDSPAWSIGSSLVTLSLPPKDPDDDDRTKKRTRMKGKKNLQSSGRSYGAAT